MLTYLIGPSLQFFKNIFKNIPWYQKFFLTFFFAKESSRLVVAASWLVLSFAKKNFKNNL